MPLYEYRCGQCGHEIEILRKVSDQAPVECPSCHAVGMQKKLTAAGFQLKGTGWYATDFRNSGSGAARADKPGDEAAAAAVNFFCLPRARLVPLLRRRRRPPRPLRPATPPERMRRYFIAGLLVWIPLGITFWVLRFIVITADQTLGVLPLSWRPEALFGHSLPGIGLVIAALVILLTGVVAANYVGRRLLRFGEGLLVHIPVVKSIYGGVKQVSETLFSSDGQAFRQALLVQYPRAGCWTIAFQTGVVGGEVRRALDSEHVSVYVPTTPNPTGGYFILVKKSDCIELDMSVDEALNYVISMGVIAPGGPKNPHLKLVETHQQPKS
jgi:putative FmdB family regulatory protein